MGEHGPLRSTELVVRCASCEDIATSHCRRCNRPACDEHAPDRRCEACESELERRLAGLGPIHLDKGVKTAGKAALYAGIGAGTVFGFIALVLGTVGVVTGGLSVFQAVAMAIGTWLIFGFLGATTVGVLSLPFIGAGGAIAGSRLFRKQVEKTRFLRERPGQRRLPAATSPIDDDDGAS